MSKIQELANFFLDLLKEIKLFHWFTKNYELHLIFGELYSSLSSSLDEIVEGMIGESRKLNIGKVPKIVRGDPLGNIRKCEDVLREMKCARTRAAVDDSLKSIGKFFYLVQLAR